MSLAPREDHGAEGSEKLTRFAQATRGVQAFVKRNETVFWWLHTAYALGLGAFVATFAQKGFERARALTLSLAVACLLVVFFFRFFGTGSTQDFMTAWPGMRRRFFFMSYVMKNLFQGMLFFLLPFYWKSSSAEAGNLGITVGLLACAILSTLDLLFDRVLLRFKSVASAFFALTLFCASNLVIPALVPETRVIVSLMVSTVLAISTFILFHLSFASLRRPLALGGALGAIVLGSVAVYTQRAHFPPVPLQLLHGGVGTSVGDDGSLMSELHAIRVAELARVPDGLYGVTDVRTIGASEHFRHAWYRDGELLLHQAFSLSPADSAGVTRVASVLPASSLGQEWAGTYHLRVVTSSDQVIADIPFEVRP